jgi:6-phosphogluconate dehydrogenase
MVTAGQAIDDLMQELLPRLTPGDILMDGGNSHFRDTDRRQAVCQAQGVHFLGIGISGGETGARYGPSIMVGGSAAAYEQTATILQTIAAQVGPEPCCAYLGQASAGHYVKMIHNAIEYALMQALAESYDLMRRGLGLAIPAMQAVYHSWRSRDFGGFLLDITADLLPRADDLNDGFLLDHILDTAGQKGTGLWNVEAATALQMPSPSLDASVSARSLSALHRQRQQAAARYGPSSVSFPLSRDSALPLLADALEANMLIAFAQGLAQLQQASQTYRYRLSLYRVATIWRGGCIIRTPMLAMIRDAYRQDATLENLLLSPPCAGRLARCLPGLRQITAAACICGIPAPVLLNSLAYFDAYRSPRLPTNLIQAQRDYFGAHTYRRTDRPGAFHTDWNSD